MTAVVCSPASSTSSSSWELTISAIRAVIIRSSVQRKCSSVMAFNGPIPCLRASSLRGRTSFAASLCHLHFFRRFGCNGLRTAAGFGGRRRSYIALVDVFTHRSGNIFLIELHQCVRHFTVQVEFLLAHVALERRELSSSKVMVRFTCFIGTSFLSRS